MHLRNLTRALFRFSDAMAWLLFVLAAISAVGIFLVDVAPPARFTPGERLHVAIPCLAIAIGAVLLARRRVAGLPLIMLLLFVPGVGEYFLLTYVIFASMVFGLPFGTAFLAVYARAVARTPQRVACEVRVGP